jgi:Virus neck protein
MLNPFFLQGSKTEQSLVQDLINEQLRMYGVEIYYVPRQYITKKTVIKEVIESKFQHAYPLEAYVDTYEGYEGQGTILSKFGVQPLTDLTLIISRERYETYITPLIENLPNIELPVRPKEGDLIYFPLGDRLFEIKFVEHEQPFYQLQKTYVYELKCELFRYEDEIVDTGIEELDDNIKKEGYIQTLNLIGSGVTATAFAGIVNGGVRYVTVNNRGNGFKSVPQVAFSSAPSGGLTAVGIATMIGGLVDCNGTSSLKVQGVQLINPGYGYTVPPSVVFNGGGGSGVAATATIGDGIVGIITLTNGGSGYAVEPTVTISGPGAGTTAIAQAKINSVGVVTEIAITNAGVGYTSAPTITISSPYMIGIGTYIYNEIVVGSISSTTARVRNWDITTGQLEVYEIDGNFVDGDIITGQNSSAFYMLRNVIIDNIEDNYSENAEIETEASTIIDFSESNPFGNP